MTLSDLVDEYVDARVSGGLVLSESEVMECALRAVRYYAAYGDIRSISGSDPLQGAAGAGAPVPAPLDPEPVIAQGLPIKSMALISDSTELTPGEWAIASPLFTVYVEKENALRLEATRGLGVDVFGRSVSEIAADIPVREQEVRQLAFQIALITV